MGALEEESARQLVGARNASEASTKHDAQLCVRADAFQRSCAVARLNAALDKMKTRVLVALYFVLWATIAAGVIYVAMRAGHSVWVAGPLAYLLFIFVNGSLAYF